MGPAGMLMPMSAFRMSTCYQCWNFFSIGTELVTPILDLSKIFCYSKKSNSIGTISEATSTTNFNKMPSARTILL